MEKVFLQCVFQPQLAENWSGLVRDEMEGEEEGFPPSAPSPLGLLPVPPSPAAEPKQQPKVTVSVLKCLKRGSAVHAETDFLTKLIKRGKTNTAAGV